MASIASCSVDGPDTVQTGENFTASVTASIRSDVTAQENVTWAVRVNGQDVEVETFAHPGFGIVVDRTLDALVTAPPTATTLTVEARVQTDGGGGGYAPL